MTKRARESGGQAADKAPAAGPQQETFFRGFLKDARLTAAEYARLVGKHPHTMRCRARGEYNTDDELAILMAALAEKGGDIRARIERAAARIRAR